MKKRTLKKSVSFSGIGLHSGKEVSVNLCPADKKHGIKFQRIDLEDQPIVPADVNYVIDTNRGTKIKKGKAVVGTIEHLMSALYALKIDNVLIEINGREVPIMDGSATPFVKAIEEAGIQIQDEDKEIFVCEEPIIYTDESTGTELILVPSEKFEVTTMIDFDSAILGQQFAELGNLEEYKNQIAPCKTFVFVHELVNLIDQDLIKGGNLNNAIVIADEKITNKSLETISRKIEIPNIEFNMEGVVNKRDLIFSNEPARHKLLDVIGDISLTGHHIQGKILATKPGHFVNIEFAKLIKNEIQIQKKLKGRPKYDPNQKALLNLEDIKKMLPHRYPFLLVDKIIDLNKEQVVGIKNVTGNESFFQGHFPDNPVFPGVLQMEALAQTGGILVLSTVDEPHLYDTYFLKMDNVKFKQMVIPGDTLILKMELLTPIRRGIVHMQGSAYVGDKLVSVGELTAQIVKRT